jgi:hypothetical protein
VALAQLLQQQGFEVSLRDGRHLMAGRNLPDSLHLTGGAAISVTAVTARDFPCTLVLHTTGVPNLRRLHRLSHPTAALPHGHKVYYPGEVGTNGSHPSRLPQIGFNYLVTIATAYPCVRVQYLTAP